MGSALSTARTADEAFAKAEESGGGGEEEEEVSKLMIPIAAAGNPEDVWEEEAEAECVGEETEEEVSIGEKRGEALRRPVVLDEATTKAEDKREEELEME